MPGFYNMQQQYPQRRPDEGLSLYLKDQNGNPMLWVDAGGNFWGYDQNNLFGNTDANGNFLQNGLQAPMYTQNQQQQQVVCSTYQQPIQQQPQLQIGQKQQELPQQGFGFNNQNTQKAPMQSNRISKFGRNKNNRPSNEPINAPQQQPVKVEEVWVNLTGSGYMPTENSEFIPLYDDETEEVVITIDEENKRFTLLVKTKDK